jgi:predicted ATPase
MVHDMRQFQSTLIARLQRGEHLVLYGPRGSGKTTLLARLHAHFERAGIPCALASVTACLDDITRTFEHAYPEVDTAAITRRRARSRLRLAADRRAGVLLLDHATRVSTAMLGFLRRLRGGIASALLVVDVEVERDLERVRGWHLGSFRLRMVPATPRQLHKLFRSHCAEHSMPHVAPGEERQIVRAARGRPGWIVECTRRIPRARYWRGGTLHVSTLCVDTEIALRQGELKLLASDVDSG